MHWNLMANFFYPNLHPVISMYYVEFSGKKQETVE